MTLINKAVKLYTSGRIGGLKQVSKATGLSKSRIQKHLLMLGLMRSKKEGHDLFSEISGRKYHNLDFFNQIDTQKKAYWLGFIYGDGSVSIDPLRGLYRFSITLKDETHVGNLASIFNVAVRRTQNGYFAIEVCNKAFVIRLAERGIIPRKSYSSSISVFNHVPPPLERHFIRGIMDADGSVCITGVGLLTIVFGGSKPIVSKIRNILVQCVGVRVNSVVSGSGCIYHQVVWAGKGAKLICSWLYDDANVFLERKYNKFLKGCL